MAQVSYFAVYASRLVCTNMQRSPVLSGVTGRHKVTHGALISNCLTAWLPSFYWSNSRTVGSFCQPSARIAVYQFHQALVAF
jgi:hypothetical protein